MAWLITAVILLIVTCNLNFSTGYKWVKVNPGSELPNNTISLGQSNKYVGRVVQYNTVQPAEVLNSSHATLFNIYTNSYDPIEDFEVLTATEPCEWKYFFDFSGVKENVVRVGSGWNREPIYLGLSDINRKQYAIASILMTSKQFVSSQLGNKYALVCDVIDTWIDATAPTIPENAVSIDRDNFVARLMGPLSFIPAYIRTNPSYCSTYFKETQIKSHTCQVLIATSDQYAWELPRNFEQIPENAVVVGRNEKNEFIYLQRINSHDLHLVTFSDLINDPLLDFEILVRNSV